MGRRGSISSLIVIAVGFIAGLAVYNLLSPQKETHSPHVLSGATKAYAYGSSTKDFSAQKAFVPVALSAYLTLHDNSYAGVAYSYIINRSFVKFVTDTSVVALDGADPRTFQILYNPPVLGNHEYDDHYSGYAKDKHQVYYLANSIPGADAATFRYVRLSNESGPDYYMKDKSHVYCDGKVMTAADVDTFNIYVDPVNATRYGADAQDTLHLFKNCEMISR